MAPKRKAPVAAIDSDEEAELAAKPAKKAAVKKALLVPTNPDAFTNKEFPAALDFARPAEGAVRIAAWNTAGIRSADKKGGLKIYVDAEDADILLITETKIDVEANLPCLNDKYPFRYWGADPKKGYAGVAALSKVEPMSIVHGIPSDTPAYKAETNGRLITLEFPSCYVLVAYSPNAGPPDKETKMPKEMERKVEWNTKFEAYLRILDSAKPVVWTGDQNVVRTENDIRHWKTNQKSAGCTPTERAGFESQLNPTDSKYQPLIDVWRQRNADVSDGYTYYGYRADCRTKGIGWRLDMMIVSQRILDKVTECEIRAECYGASDHLPLMLDIILPLE